MFNSRYFRLWNSKRFYNYWAWRNFNFSCSYKYYRLWQSCSGSIDLQISGEIHHTFQWSNGAVTEDISALIAQTYSVTVTDSKDVIEKEFTITRPDDLEIDLATNIYAVCESREAKQYPFYLRWSIAHIIQWSGGEVTGNNKKLWIPKLMIIPSYSYWCFGLFGIY